MASIDPDVGDTDQEFDLVVVGAGVAGLSAAVSFVNAIMATGAEDVRMAVLERAPRNMRGGSSRWTGAYLRMAAPDSLAEGFIDDLTRFSNGYSDAAVIERLAAEAPDTLMWFTSLGIHFEHLPTIFLTATRPRLLPVGGGQAVVERLAATLEEMGVPIYYETAAYDLKLTDGRVTGLEVRDPTGVRHWRTRAVILASGGFEGNPEMLARYVGPHAHTLRNISPGGTFNRGEGIDMALRVGARGAGEFGSFHAEPVDPRSRMPEAVIMLFPYGILVNRQGERFVDEGADTIDEIYEGATRQILAQPGQEAYVITDQRVFTVPDYHRALGTDQDPIVGETLDELEQKLAIPTGALMRTVAAFNAATTHHPASAAFTPLTKDGRGTRGLVPAKSNWAWALEQPPYVAWPVVCSIVFTFGGLAVNHAAEVVDHDGRSITGLYAAGEITGLYYHKYPGATSFLRGAVFGRIAGREVARFVTQSGD